MKYLSAASILSVLTLFLLSAAQQATAQDKVRFTKRIDVFGIHLYGTPAAPDRKMHHAANVLAQYLDNDEDGVPDNPRVVAELVKKKSVLIMTKDSGREWQSIHADLHDVFPDSVYHDCFANESRPNAIEDESFDGLWEEVLHLLTRHGWGNAYPEVFGPVPGTKVAAAVDLARDGHFVETPKGYSDDAWYKYTDESCAYGCQIDEYMYWTITTLLGAQSLGDRENRVNHEWGLNTPAKLQAGDPSIYALLTDPQYKFPTVLPDGNYRDTKFPIGAISFEIKVQDENAFPPEGRYPATVSFITECQAPSGEAVKISFAIADGHQYAGRKLSLTTPTPFTLDSELFGVIADIRPELKGATSLEGIDLKSIEGRPVWLTTEPRVGVSGSIFPRIVKIEEGK